MFRYIVLIHWLFKFKYYVSMRDKYTKFDAFINVNSPVHKHSLLNFKSTLCPNTNSLL